MDAGGIRADGTFRVSSARGVPNVELGQLGAVRCAKRGGAKRGPRAQIWKPVLLNSKRY